MIYKIKEYSLTVESLQVTPQKIKIDMSNESLEDLIEEFASLFFEGERKTSLYGADLVIEQNRTKISATIYKFGTIDDSDITEDVKTLIDAVLPF